MPVLRYSLFRIMKNKIKMIIILIAPTILLLTFVSENTTPPLTVAVVDYDQTVLTGHLIDRIESVFVVKEIEHNEIMAGIIGNKIDYAIIIPEGFTQNVIENNHPQIEGIGIEETNRALPAERHIENIMNTYVSIASVAHSEESIFYEGLAHYDNVNMAMDFNMMNELNTNRTRLSLGFLTQFMLYMSVLTAGIIVEDREKRTIYRVLSTPISLRRYILENIICFYTIALIQVAIIFVFLKLVLKVYFGPSILSMFILFSVFALVCVSLGVFIASFCKKTFHVYLIIFLITTPLVMLGGAYWPRSDMSEMLIRISDFIPVSWVLDGASKLVQGGQLQDVVKEMGILMIFTVVFFLLGTTKKKDFLRRFS